MHHNLIQEVLLYQYIPDKTQALMSSLYAGFHTAVITDHYSTPTIPVRRGILQGDCLRPLLFNMCFNTFTQVIRQLRMINQISFSNRVIGFNSQMMLLLSQEMSVRINSYQTVLQNGISSLIWTSE